MEWFCTRRGVLKGGGGGCWGVGNLSMRLGGFVNGCLDGLSVDGEVNEMDLGRFVDSEGAGGDCVFFKAR